MEERRFSAAIRAEKDGALAPVVRPRSPCGPFLFYKDGRSCRSEAEKAMEASANPKPHALSSIVPALVETARMEHPQSLCSHQNHRVATRQGRKVSHASEHKAGPGPSLMQAPDSGC